MRIASTHRLPECVWLASPAPRMRVADVRRPRLSTGAPVIDRSFQPADPGYRPEPPSRRPRVSTGVPRYRPELLSRDTHFYAVGRHPLLRTPGCVAGSRFGSVRGEAEGAGRPELQPAGPGYRPELRVIDRSFQHPTPDIDRSSALSTGASSIRPPISTGAPRYRPEPPSRRPRISTGARRYIDLSLHPPALDIDRSSALST